MFLRKPENCILKEIVLKTSMAHVVITRSHDMFSRLLHQKVKSYFAKYHVCWWPGDARSQANSSLVIDLDPFYTHGIRLVPA